MWLGIGIGGLLTAIVAGSIGGGGDDNAGGAQGDVNVDAAGNGGNGATDSTVLGDDNEPSDPSNGDATPDSTTEAPPTTELAPFDGRAGMLSDPNGFQRAYPDADVNGLLTFRGNPTRSFHGTGPVPRTQPQVLWKYPG